MAETMRIIKRYKNRRLYDTEDSRTMTQKDLAELVRQGVEVRVVDIASGEDITLAVLSRIVTAEAPKWGNLKQSTELFRKMITLGGNKSMGILKNTILASIGAFHVTKDKAETIIDELIKRGELDKSDRKQAVMELLERAEKSTAEFKDKVAEGAGRAQKEVTTMVKKLNLINKDDLKALETKVDKLSKVIAKLEKKLDEK